MVSCGRSSQKEGYPGATTTATTTATTMARATTVLLMYYAALERAGAGFRRQASGGTRYTVSPFTWALWWHNSIFFKRERGRGRGRKRERKVQIKAT